MLDAFKTNGSSPPVCRVARDVLVTDHGSIVLFKPATKSALCWLLNNTQQDAQWFGGALVVEPRYVDTLLDGLHGEGFIIEMAR
jgi:hypothetical protein